MNNQDAAAARRTDFGFTLVEMLISTAVLVLLILIVTQVINTAATTVRPANRHIDTDTEARTVFDRMAVDFAQMVKRSDVDYYFKANGRKYPGHSGGHSKGGGTGGTEGLEGFIAVYAAGPCDFTTLAKPN